MVTVRYFAGARAAAGTASEQVRADSLGELLTGLADRHGDGLGRVLGAASFLVDGVAAHDHQARLRVGCTVDVLPPFAGG
ncbi:MoaD/ThiS family protein [Actinocatenispora sera]|uniref:Molybdopterin synthase sulfur carrier subunit n=1 Tax=Actinocatenispora sera TaxID=390989 RepID=A0A810KXA3_9ACTN|nr:MoaD/ThiS family protein [Actinocatenispora sera]BCJ26979.1 molybdopterin synthase sulfur carrier subunit [Actinocatenispora sera]